MRGKSCHTAAVQMVILSRPLAAAALVAALTALAGCSAGGSSAAGAGNAAASAAVSAVASRSPIASTSAKPSAPAATSATASTAAPPASTPTPTAAASTPRSALSASALLDSALSAVQAQQSVHVVCSTPNGVQTTDVGVANGRSSNTMGDVSISNSLINGIAYLTTNTAGVWTSEGLTQAEADKLVAGGDWVSFKPGQSYGDKVLSYANAILGMTVADQAAFLRLAGTLTRTAATSAQGVPVYGVTGSVPPPAPSGPQTVYIAATGAPLPVRTTIPSKSGTVTCDYSDWGKPLNVTAPANVVPVTSIHQ